MKARRRYCQKLAAAVAGGCVTISVAAFAEEPEQQAGNETATGQLDRRVALSIPACSGLPFDPKALLALLRIELAASGFAVALEVAHAERAGVRVELEPSSCAVERAEVSFVVAQSQPLHIALAEVPAAARARTLALAIAEAVRVDDWASELASAGTGVVVEASVVPAVKPSARAAAPNTPEDELYYTGDPYDRWPALGYAAKLMARSFYRDRTALLGAELAGNWVLSHRVRATLGLSYVTGSEAIREESIQWWDAGLGLDVNLARRPSLRMGVRANGGHVTAHLPSALQRAESFVISVGARSELALPLNELAALDLFIEARRELYAVPAFAGAGIPEIDLPSWALGWGIGLELLPN